MKIIEKNTEEQTDEIKYNALPNRTGSDDVAPRNRSRVNESPHPARLGRGLHHETHPSHT